MTRKARSHLTDGADRDYAPRHLTKQEFGRRLYKRMVEKGWKQSELARAAGLPRDSISTYIRGRVLPTDHSLRKLASALGCEPIDLLPNHVESAIDEDMPAVEMRVSPGAPDKAWLRVNQLVSFETAADVIALIRKDANAADRE